MYLCETEGLRLPRQHADENRGLPAVYLSLSFSAYSEVLQVMHSPFCNLLLPEQSSFTIVLITKLAPETNVENVEHRLEPAPKVTTTFSEAQLPADISVPPFLFFPTAIRDAESEDVCAIIEEDETNVSMIN